MHQLVGEGKHLVDTLRKERDEALKEIEQLKHDREKPTFKCFQCGDTFMKEKELETHFISVHVKEYEDVKSAFKNENDEFRTTIQTLKEQLEHSMEEIRCKLCDYIFKNSFTYDLHLAEDHDFGSLSRLKEELTISRRSESDCKESEERIAAELANLKREFICDKCDHQAISAKDLRKHLQKSHNYGNLKHQDELYELRKTVSSKIAFNLRCWMCSTKVNYCFQDLNHLIEHDPRIKREDIEIDIVQNTRLLLRNKDSIPSSSEHLQRTNELSDSGYSTSRSSQRK